MTPASGSPACVYASASPGLHDRRWIAALSSLGWNPVAVHRDAYDTDESFVSEVARASSGGRPVLAGPLDIAAMLAEAVERLSLLSWGYDLHSDAASLALLPSFMSVVIDSSATRGIAEAHGARRIIEIPWGIDLESFTPTGPIADLTGIGVGPEDRILLSLRAHEPLYRVADIIEASTSLPQDVVLVIGHAGSQTPQLQALATACGVRSVFIPSMDEAELPTLLRRAQAYVTASEIDGTSVTLLQAMACAVPVVASDNPGNADWVRPGKTGFTFPVGDIEGLRSALRLALDSGADHAPLVDAARSQVLERADWHANLRRLADALDLAPA